MVVIKLIKINKKWLEVKVIDKGFNKYTLEVLNTHDSLSNASVSKRMTEFVLTRSKREIETLLEYYNKKRLGKQPIREKK